MDLKEQMLDVLEQINNAEITSEIFLNNPNIKFKMALKQAMLTDGISEENAKMFIKNVKVEINDFFVEDEDLMSKAIEVLKNVFKKLMNVANELSLSIEELLEFLGEGFSLSFSS